MLGGGHPQPSCKARPQLRQHALMSSSLCRVLRRGIDVMDVLITLTTKRGVSLLNSTQVCL